MASAAEELPPTPEERTFLAHLTRSEFSAGVAANRWRLLGCDWPIVLIAVSAAKRPNSPDEFVLRFDLTGYPSVAPTSIPFDLETSDRLAPGKLPKGPRLGGSMAFRADAQGLYLPVDRSTVGHNWRTWQWDDTRDITYYLRLVHELLNADDYEGV